MIDIKFEIDGKTVKTNTIADALERAMFDSISDTLRTTLGGVRDPDTGEFPTVVVRGSSLDNMSISVEGSDEVVVLATERLQEDFEVMASPESDTELGETPYVFLCHASEDKLLVEQLAMDLRANGIEVFFDQWCIEPGDSIRQRIDEGIIECSHFVVLLTKASLDKPWVNAEIDAGFVKRLNGQCKFVPLRCELEASELPPLLSGLNSPELNDYDADLRALIGFFFGVTQKPPLGAPPNIVMNESGGMGVSAAAKRLVDLVMAGTRHGVHMDPQISAEELRTTSDLTDDEIEDAVFELEGRGLLCRHTGSNSGPLGFVRVVPEDALFVEFDQYYCDWNPSGDGLRVAVELMNGNEESTRPAILAERLGWEPRRMNPAIAYLREREIIHCQDAVGVGPWCTASFRRTPATRRFVASRR